MLVKRGEIWYADLGLTVGSEQGGIRPVLIIQNDIGNRYSPTVIVAAITSKYKNKLPTHVTISPNDSGLSKESTIMMEQIRTLDKSRLKSKVGNINMDKVEDAINISIALSISKSDQRQRLCFA